MCSRVQVKVDEGILEGYICENEEDHGKLYYNFQGIPYAKPPIGKLRFKAPQPIGHWEGVKDATEDSEQCFSRHVVYRHMKFGSEDCLYLNVFTPKIPSSQKDEMVYDLKPVMVFIHGGSFNSGSNAKLMFGPQFLIREDIVLVTINYRLGFLGFLSFEDPELKVPGNAGFKDMVLALKWVQRNIVHFNGDSNNITIFGNSAGAAAAHLLILSPLAKGLFHRAIIQSGSALNIWAPMMKLEPALAEILGIDRGNSKAILQRLRNMTVEELLLVQEKIPDPWDVSGFRPLGYVIENENQEEEPFLTKSPEELLKKGEYNHVPIIFGYNTREGMLIHFIKKTPIQKLIPELEQHVPHMLNLKKGSSLSREVAEMILRFYFGDKNIDDADIDITYEFLSDNFFIRDICRSAAAHAKSSASPIYLYEMTLETSINIFKNLSGIKSQGVCHTDEISYLFKTPLHENIIENSPEDVGIRRYCRLWTNFAKHGNPTPSERDALILAKWKPFDGENENYLDIGRDLVSRRNPKKSRMTFWENVFKFSQVSHKL